MRVRPWGADRAADDLDGVAAEDIVEATGELRIPIVDEESPGSHRILTCREEVASLLRDPAG